MSKPALALIGNSAIFAEIQPKLKQDYTLHFVDTIDGYMNVLIDNLVAMILVDSTSENWQNFVTVPKASPATRRIPILVITENPAEAILQGADLTLHPDNFSSQIVSVLNEYARVLTLDYLEQLDCECQEPLPELAIQGVVKFNAGEYYPQHDLFEAQWVKTETPVRDLYRAVLQVGVAYYQIERQNYRGALKMLQRSVQWLARLPDDCQGIDVAQLRTDSYKVRAELEQLGEDRMAEFDRSLLQPVKML